MTSSRFVTQTLAQPPPVQQQFIAPGKYIAIDDTRYAKNPREPEKQVAYGSGVASGFKPINYGVSQLINITNIIFVEINLLIKLFNLKYIN